MKFIHRLGYYLGGFAVGLVLLAFFLNGKKASCDYSPDARVLKNIRIKERAYSYNVLRELETNGIDSTTINWVLNNGDVDFGRSNTDLDSCKTYLIYGRPQGVEVELLFENCDSLATLQEVWVK